VVPDDRGDQDLPNEHIFGCTGGDSARRERRKMKIFKNVNILYLIIQNKEFYIIYNNIKNFN